MKSLPLYNVPVQSYRSLLCPANLWFLLVPTRTQEQATKNITILPPCNYNNHQHRLINALGKSTKNSTIIKVMSRVFSHAHTQDSTAKWATVIIHLRCKFYITKHILPITLYKKILPRTQHLLVKYRSDEYHFRFTIIILP